MKMLFRPTLTLVMATAFVATNAQKIKLVEGDLSALKGQTSVNIDFTYDKMQVGKLEEAEYVNDKKEAYNKKEAGKGDTWQHAWFDDRQARFEPKFIELFEKYSEFKVSSRKDAKYTLIFHTIATEPGFNVGVARKSSDIDGELLLVETANKSKVLASISVMNAKGRSFGGYDFGTGLRITEAYELAGKSIAKFIMDKL